MATRAGIFQAEFSRNGLARLDFPAAPTPAEVAPNLSSLPRPMRRWASLTRQALDAVLRGREIRQLPPLDLSAGTDFQRRVWTELRRIPPGQTLTYAALARKIGRPGAARAVGSACGANPIPLLIPCHRVVAANGGLGGFSGGLDWKRKLLRTEGTLPRSANPTEGNEENEERGDKPRRIAKGAREMLKA